MKTLTIRRMMGLIAILGFLFGLIPFLIDVGQAPRVAARRAQCLNHLKQIGIAIAAYSRAHGPGLAPGDGPYPSGTIPNAKLPPDRRYGWASLIYLDDDDGCSGCPIVSTEIPWDDPNQEGGAGRDQEMFCPSVPRQFNSKARVAAAYVGIAGLGVDAPGLPTSDRRAGVFGDDRVVRPADVTDGLAETMVIVDSAEPAGPWYAGGRNTVRGLDPSRQPYVGPGQQFGGVHGDGANVLMADGSVRHLRGAIDPKVFEAMSTIAGAEKVSVPWEK